MTLNWQKAWATFELTFFPFMHCMDYLGIFIGIFGRMEEKKIFEFSLLVLFKLWILNFVYYRFTIFNTIFNHNFHRLLFFYYILLYFCRASEAIFKFKFPATQSVINFVNESREGSCVVSFFSLSLSFFVS